MNSQEKTFKELERLARKYGVKFPKTTKRDCNKELALICLKVLFSK